MFGQRTLFQIIQRKFVMLDEKMVKIEANCTLLRDGCERRRAVGDETVLFFAGKQARQGSWDPTSALKCGPAATSSPRTSQQKLNSTGVKRAACIVS